MCNVGTRRHRRISRLVIIYIYYYYYVNLYKMVYARFFIRDNNSLTLLTTAEGTLDW